MRRSFKLLGSPQFVVLSLAVLFCLGTIWRPGMALSKVQGFISPSVKQKLPVIAHPPKLNIPKAKALAASAPPPTDCSKQPCIALTFDDGPNPIATPIVLQALEQAHAVATFFVVGSRATTMSYLLQRMHRDGDEIGDHSWSHPDMTKLTADQVRQQVAQTQAAVTAAGVPAPTLFRPPYGFVNATMQQQIKMPFIMWDDDPRDWANRNPAQIIPIVESEAKPGAIIDMHDIYTSTGQALPQLLPYLQAHYKLVTVSQLLNLNTNSRGEYYNLPSAQ